MASSGAMTAQTSSSIIRRSPVTVIALCKKEMRSNSKSFRGRKARRRPTSQRPQAEIAALIWPAGTRPLPAFFYLEVEEVEEVKEEKEVKEVKENAIRRLFLKRWLPTATGKFSVPLSPLPPLLPLPRSSAGGFIIIAPWTTNRSLACCAKPRNSWK